MFYASRPVSGYTKSQLPLALRALGHDVQLGYGTEEINHGTDRVYCGLFWAVSGRASFKIAGRPCQLNGGEALYYYPFEAHYFRVESKQFRYCWFTFDGSSAREILMGYGFPRKPFPVVPPPDDLFRQAQKNFFDFSPEARFNDAVLALRLLEHLAGRAMPERTADAASFLVRKFRNLVDLNFSDPDFNVDSAAHQLNCSRSHLSRSVKIYLGLSPSHYIENIRLNRALDQLNTSSMNCTEIAESCGFGTPEYFSRRIRKHTGLPPGQFRKAVGRSLWKEQEDL